MNVMQPAQVRCPGCERDFTPCGLSQHITKTQNLCCHHVLVTSQSCLVSGAFPHMASPLTLSSAWAPQDADEPALGNDFNEPTQGEFTMNHITAHAATLRNFLR